MSGKTGKLNFMMEGLTFFPMGVFSEEVRIMQAVFHTSDLRADLMEMSDEHVLRLP